MRTTPTQICWTKAILGTACHPMPLGKNLACDKFNHGSLTKDAVVHHIEPWLLTQPRWGIQSRSRWKVSKYWSAKGSYPPIVNHPHHDGLDSLFYLSCFTGEGMDHPAGANTSTEYLTFAHPSSNSLHSIYRYSPPDSESNFFAVLCLSYAGNSNDWSLFYNFFTVLCLYVGNSNDWSLFYTQLLLHWQ